MHQFAVDSEKMIVKRCVSFAETFQLAGLGGRTRMWRLAMPDESAIRSGGLNDFLHTEVCAIGLPLQWRMNFVERNRIPNTILVPTDGRHTLFWQRQAITLLTICESHNVSHMNILRLYVTFSENTPFRRSTTQRMHRPEGAFIELSACVRLGNNFQSFDKLECLRGINCA